MAKQNMPTLYVHEYVKLQELFYKGASRTNVGSDTFTSNSSGVTYTYTGGDNDLYNQLGVALKDYLVTADDVNMYSITVTSATYNMTNAYDVINCDCTSNNITVNLPTAVGNYKEYTIRKADSSDNIVTVEGYGSEIINGESSYIIQFKNSAMTILSDGTNWIIK